MKSSARPIVAALVVIIAAFAFWTVALSPKRHEANELSAQIESLEAGIQSAQAQVTQATAARHSFPVDYHQLVELGQAVPSTDETPSLLIELDRIAAETHVSFNSIQLEASSSESVELPEATAPKTAEGTAPASEVAASLLPLGASVGTAGLAVMPYNLQFQGNFFQITKFIGKVDALVESKEKSGLAVDGRLITINGFSLAHSSKEAEGGAGGSSELEASFSVMTYLTPPGQGITAGATPTAPSSSSTQTVAAE
jgi:Tfp pilus assembly protein PilO